MTRGMKSFCVIMFTPKIADDFNSDKINLPKISMSENFTELI